MFHIHDHFGSLWRQTAALVGVDLACRAEQSFAGHRRARRCQVTSRQAAQYREREAAFILSPPDSSGRRAGNGW